MKPCVINERCIIYSRRCGERLRPVRPVGGDRPVSDLRMAPRRGTVAPQPGHRHLRAVPLRRRVVGVERRRPVQLRRHARRAARPSPRGWARSALPREAAGGNLVAIDPPGHTELRRVVNRGFTPRTINGWRPRIDELVTELLARCDRRPAGRRRRAGVAAARPGHRRTARRRRRTVGRLPGLGRCVYPRRQRFEPGRHRRGGDDGHLRHGRTSRRRDRRAAAFAS